MTISMRRPQWVALVVAAWLAAVSCTSAPVAGPSASLTVGGSAIEPSSPSATTSATSAAPRSPSGSSISRDGSVVTAPSAQRPPSTQTRPVGTATAPSSPAPTVSTAPTPSSAPSGTAARGSARISPREAADRAAVEAAWLRFWNAYNSLLSVPMPRRTATMRQVAAVPLAAVIVTSASEAEKGHINNYGSMLHRIYWGPDIGGSDTASIGDCADESEFGTVDTRTNKRLTHGDERVNFRGTLSRDSLGVWRVLQVQFLDGSPC